MTYQYVYVAQVAQGADAGQMVKAFTEAESYPGPSLIIAYAPCINHGIHGGMKNTQHEEKKAVDAGYWHLFRYDPRRAAEGKNPLVLDSHEPKEDYKQFILGEVRYNRLHRADPERADKIFDCAAKNAREKYEALKASAE